MAGKNWSDADYSELAGVEEDNGEYQEEELIDFASARVRGPAIGLMVTAILGIVTQMLGLVLSLVGSGFEHMAMEGPHDGARLEPFRQLPEIAYGIGGMVGPLVGIGVGGFVLFGSLQMKNLESYSVAMVAAILALVPCVSPCCLLGLPFGIWALVVLSDEKIKAAFYS